MPLPGDWLTNKIIVFFDQPIQAPGGPSSVLLGPGLPAECLIGSNYVRVQSSRIPSDRVVQLDLSGVQSADGKPINPEQKIQTFAAFVFAPQQVFFVQRQNGQIEMGMAFPTEVRADEVQAHLRAMDAKEQPVPFTVSPGKDAKIVQISVPETTAWPLQLIVSAGLKDASGFIALADEHTFSYMPSTDLAVSKVEWGTFSPERQDLHIYFSSPVLPDALKEHLSITDANSGEEVGYELDNTEASSDLVIGVHVSGQAQAQITVNISQGLESTDGMALGADYTANLAGPENRLAIQNYWWNYPEREGLALYLQLSQRVEANQLRQYIAVEPAIENLRVESEGYNSYMVYGDWKPQQAYTITVKAGLPYWGGQTLDSDQKAAIKTERLPAYMGFGYKDQYYFPRKAGMPLDMESRGVSKVKLTLYRLFPSNLPAAVEDINSGNGSWRFTTQFCEQLAQTEMPVANDPSSLVKTPIDISAMNLNNTRGVFCLEAEGKVSQSGEEDEGSRSGTKIIVWTDIGVLAHWQNQELALFAHDLYSLAPIARAKVTVYSAKNQVLAEWTTDEQGMAYLSGFNPSLGAPALAVVEHEQDFTFLPLQHNADDPVAYDEGQPFYDAKGYDAFIYADRELYRPGETAHVHWVVRQRYGDAVGALPLQMRILKPNGRKLLEQAVMLSDTGTGGFDFVSQRAYPTGKYTAQLLLPGKDNPIGSYTFSLEDFVPNRIKVKLNASEAPLRAGQPEQVSLNAQHLFGAPAADRKCELKIALQRKGFKSKQWEAFRFDNDADFKPDIVDLGQQTTDAEGNATFDFTYQAPAEATSPLMASLVGRVFELGGRSVGDAAQRVLFPSDIALGINAAAAAQGQGVDVQVVAIQPDESPAALDKVTVRLEKQSWNYYVRRYYGHHESNWSESFETVDTKEAPLTNGQGAVNFALSDSYGYYRIKVESPATKQYSTVSFYAYGEHIEVVSAPRPSLIKLTLDKDRYEVGETAQLKVESPFDGKGIVVLQAGNIQRMTPIEITNGIGMLPIEVTREQFPNAWIEVTVIHAFDIGHKQVYPFSSFAMAGLTVHDNNRELKVSLPELPAEIRPASQATFTVETRNSADAPTPAEITLAAVDEGIHLVTNYENPNPYKWLSRTRRPDFRRSHYYDKIAYNFDKPDAGGDLDALLGKRSTSPDENWIKPLSLWSGVVKTDANGRATVSFDVPEFSGQLRLVAVASSDAATGVTSANVFVRRPYMLRASMPRFLLPGDRIDCKVVVFNTSEAPVKAAVRWAASGAIAQGEGSQVLDVPAKGEANVSAAFTAALAVGQGAIHWEASITDAQGAELEKLVQDAPIPVRAPAAYQSSHELAVLKPGETRSFRNVKFVDDGRAEMLVDAGATPFLRLTSALRYLIGYPHGCVEQTTSRLFPMFILRQQMDVLGAAFEEKPRQYSEVEVKTQADLDVLIQNGIYRLFAMQTSEGGLSFWPGDSVNYEYGSVYGLHFLTLVKNARVLDVPDDNYAALQRYVRGVATNWGDSTDQSNYYLRAYAIYVLSLGGDQEAIGQISRFDTISIPECGRYLLAAAVALTTQDKARISLYLTSAPKEPYNITEPDGTLISDIRNKAIELMALQQAGGEGTDLAKRADALFAYLEKQDHGTTQETSFVVAALAQYIEALQANISTTSATITGPKGEQAIQGNAIYKDTHEGPGAAYTVANTGQADLYVNVTTRGVPMAPNLEAVSNNLDVERTLYTSAGEAIDLSKPYTFDQGRSYVAQVRFNSERELKNLVVVDLLPAGFELENPRLDVAAIPGAAFENATTPSNLDVRDDRIILAFNSIEAGTHYAYYVVRAITPGTYQHPPVEAECMYDPTVNASSAPSSVEVK